MDLVRYVSHEICGPLPKTKSENVRILLFPGTFSLHLAMHAVARAALTAVGMTSGVVSDYPVKKRRPTKFATDNEANLCTELSIAPVSNFMGIRNVATTPLILRKIGVLYTVSASYDVTNAIRGGKKTANVLGLGGGVAVNRYCRRKL